MKAKTLKLRGLLGDYEPPVLPMGGTTKATEWVGYCNEACPSHDGKRCYHLGCRAPYSSDICPLWAEWAAGWIKELEEDAAEAAMDAAGASR